MSLKGAPILLICRQRAQILFAPALFVIFAYAFCGCLAYDDIKERSGAFSPEGIAPIIQATDPLMGDAVIQIDKKCKGYRFRITKLINSEGEDLNAQDVRINWFLDYYKSNLNPLSVGLSLIISANSLFAGDEPGVYHVVDVVVSDQEFANSGSYINWEPQEGAHWTYARWVVKVVDESPVRSDPRCVQGYVGE